MKRTTNYGFNLPEANDFYDIEHMNSNFEGIDTALANIQTTSRASLSTAGWYRVAEYYCVDNGANIGRSSNSFQIILRNRRASDSNSEYHRLQVTSVYAKQSIVSLESKGYSETAIRVFTKARYTYDGNTAYLEIYYAPSVNNPVSFFVADSGDANGNYWQAITPTLTAEEVDGVTVTTTYDIPANASPVTDLDIAQFKGTETIQMPILEKALSVDFGVHNFILNPSFATDVPQVGYSYGTATIIKRSTKNILVILWGLNGFSNYPPMFNYLYASDNWTGWERFATTADIANYLPKDGGGIVNGNIWSSANDTSVRVIGVENSARCVYQNISATGTYALYDDTNKKNIIQATTDGTNTFNGTATGNLALVSTGAQQIDGNTITPLVLNNTASASTRTSLQFKLRGETLGSIGFDGANNLIMRPTDDSGIKTILHTGNSAKVVVSDTAPTDTSALWVW